MMIGICVVLAAPFPHTYPGCARDFYATDAPESACICRERMGGGDHWMRKALMVAENYNPVGTL
jgi:hypothetical protein